MSIQAMTLFSSMLGKPNGRLKKILKQILAVIIGLYDQYYVCKLNYDTEKSEFRVWNHHNFSSTQI